MLVTKQVTTLFQSNVVFHSGDDEQLNGGQDSIDESHTIFNLESEIMI